MVATAVVVVAVVVTVRVREWDPLLLPFPHRSGEDRRRAAVPRRRSAQASADALHYLFTIYFMYLFTASR